MYFGNHAATKKGGTQGCTDEYFSNLICTYKSFLPNSESSQYHHPQMVYVRRDLKDHPASIPHHRQ